MTKSVTVKVHSNRDRFEFSYRGRQSTSILKLLTSYLRLSSTETFNKCTLGRISGEQATLVDFTTLGANGFKDGDIMYIRFK